MFRSMQRSGYRLWIFFLVLGFLALSEKSYSAWNESELGKRLTVTSPASGVSKVEVFRAEKKAVFVVVADYQGGPLPPKQTIALSFEPPVSGRVHASYFQGQLYLPFQTKPAWVPGLDKLPGQTQFALWQEKSGEWGALISLSGGGCRTYLEGGDGKVLALADSLADNFTPSRVPLFALGWDRDPYRLIHDLYAFGMKIMKEADPEGVIGKLRVEKPYPEIFRYLGWCSWNAHYRKIDEQKLLAHAKSFQAAGFPLRWMLIDDCWSTVNTSTLSPWAQGHLFLTGLPADPVKFPRGLGATVKTLKQDYGITWVGTWNTFNGYWNGIALDSPVGRELRASLMPISEKVGIPDPRSDAGVGFWDAWYKYEADAGIDFVKVDNQGTLSAYLKGKLPISKAMAQSQKNLQAATTKYFQGNVLNCMEMNVDVIYQWASTNLGRSSVDYTPISYHNPRINAITNVYNSLWFSELTYPDYDMFMTHDGHPEYYAVPRAVSGGPIYITDQAGEERWDVLRPLVLADGRVIQVDEPGLPIKKNLLVNPLLDRKPLVSFGRTGEGGVMSCLNVDKFERPVRMELAPTDIEGIQGERFAVYEHFTGQLFTLGREEKFPVRLGRWDLRVYSVMPVVDGFAPIGLVNKYVSPATLKGLIRESDKVIVGLAEPGLFAAYCETKPDLIKLNGAVISADQITYSDGLLKVDLGPAKAAGPVGLEIIW